MTPGRACQIVGALLQWAGLGWLTYVAGWQVSLPVLVTLMGVETARLSGELKEDEHEQSANSKGT